MKNGGWIAEMAQAYANLRVALAGLSDDQLDALPRGRMDASTSSTSSGRRNAPLIRFKLALTEDNPPIKTYEETLWAETIDGAKRRSIIVEAPRSLTRTLDHPTRFTSWSDFARRLQPPTARVMTIDKAIQLYAGTAFITPPTSPGCASTKVGRRMTEAVSQ